MAGVRGDISVSMDLTLTGAGDLGNPKQRVSIAELISLSEGTDAINKADILFQDTRTLSASASENLDMAGVLANAFGATITAAEIVAMFFRAADTNTNAVQVARPASNGLAAPFLAAGDGVAILPGEFALFASEKGWAVTGATGDLISVTNGGAGSSVTYDVVIVARTVAA